MIPNTGVYAFLEKMEAWGKLLGGWLVPVLNQPLLLATWCRLFYMLSFSGMPHTAKHLTSLYNFILITYFIIGCFPGKEIAFQRL